MQYNEEKKKGLLEKYLSKIGVIGHCIHHHTHSRYHYNEEGIAINKGDWLINQNPKGKNGLPLKVIVVKDKLYLNKLLIKQCSFEIVCGFVKCNEELEFYLIEYFCNNIDYVGEEEIDIEKMITDVITYVNKKCRINKKKMKDDKKVKISPRITDKSEIGRLSRKGEKMYYDYYIEKFVNKYLGRNKKWYCDNKDKCEIKVSERRIKQYISEH